MKKREKVMTCSIVFLLIIIFFIILVVMVPWGIMFIGTHSLTDPLKSEITYAEFPFTLEYEINGEKKIVQDTLICEYDGAESLSIGSPKTRKWKQRFASGNNKIFLFVGENVKTVQELSSNTVAYQEIFFYPGDAWYYMDDYDKDTYEDYKEDYEDESWYLLGVKYFEQDYGETGNDGTTGFDLDDDVLFERFGIKIISWKCAPPINNNFEE